MATYLDVLIFSLLGGVFSLIGGLLLLGSKKTAGKLAAYATPFAAGALLAAVFLDLLKEGARESDINQVVWSALIGVLVFFFAEYYLRWFHHHHDHSADDKRRPVSMIIIGDTAHNTLDGVAIASAFLISVPTGIITTIAVAAHEIPQEIGDMGLLLSRGLNRFKVAWVSIASALATTAAALGTFALGSEDKLPIGVMLGLSAGFLLYIATSDLIPTIHESANRRRLNWQPILLLVGVGVVALSIELSHKYTG
jgi:zinc and cadmium transporter